MNVTAINVSARRYNDATRFALLLRTVFIGTTKNCIFSNFKLHNVQFLFSLSLCLSVPPSLYPCLSISESLFLCHSVSLSLCFCLSVSLPLFPFPCLSISLSVYLSVSQRTTPSHQYQPHFLINFETWYKYINIHWDLEKAAGGI